MDAFTRRQLQALSAEFYRVHADEFDASRGHRAWPGFARVFEVLRTSLRDSGRPAGAPLRVLDVGCGNARLAAFLHAALAEAGEARPLDYHGVDASTSLLEAAQTRLRPELAASVRLEQHDFLASASPGDGLPEGPFDLVAVFGVLHHVPGRESRRALLEAARDRLAEGGLLALAAWQFAGRTRFERRRVAWSELPPILGAAVDPRRLEPGDFLLRFGSDPAKPPRYCHQMADAELDALPEALGLERVADFRADGAGDDLNRYLLLRRP